MSPQAGELLVQEIAPRIRSSLSHCVSQVGPDDLGELVQDTIATAAQLLHSVETRGKKVTAGNISYYAVRLTREGRRSTGFKKTDPLHPAAQIAGRSRVVSLEEPLGGEIEDQETLCLLTFWPPPRKTRRWPLRGVWIGQGWSSRWTRPTGRSSAACSKARI